MPYRTKTYIAGDWDGDRNAIDQLYRWKANNHLTFDFHDAHDLTQARDSSLNCSIKRSLATRLNVSKTFVLIVGKNTKTVRSGGCLYCKSYNSWNGYCARGYNVDHRSYVEYECEKAIQDGLKIVVLYNSYRVDRSKCPDCIKYEGKHAAMWTTKDGHYVWDYYAVKAAFED